VHRTEELVIRLPAGWQAELPDAGGAAAALPAFEQSNPELAGFLGGEGALSEAAFLARDESPDAAGFADNLSVRRTAWSGPGEAGLPEVAATIAAQYRQLGLEVTETATGVEVGGLPAAGISYTFAATNRDGGTVALSGLQTLVAAPGELWILTYTTRSDRFDAVRPAFEESARSFQVR
jgi:hypothetical protein